MPDPDRYPFTLGVPEVDHDRTTRMVHLAFPVTMTRHHNGATAGQTFLGRVDVPAHHWATPLGRKLTIDKSGEARIESWLCNSTRPGTATPGTSCCSTTCTLGTARISRVNTAAP